MDRPSQGARALNDWCGARRGRAEGLAKACGVTATTVYNWRRGAIRPSTPNRGTIDQHTDGAVPAPLWDVPSAVSVPPPAIDAPADATIPDAHTLDAA